MSFDPLFSAGLRRELEQAVTTVRVQRRVPRLGITVRLVAAGAVLVQLVLAIPAMGELSQHLRGFSSHAGSGTPGLASSPSPTASPTASVTPGAAVITPLAALSTVTLSGTHTVDLGPRPTGANGFTYSFECLTSGEFGLGTVGASVSCGKRDAGGRGGQTGSVDPEKLVADQHTFTITAEADARWTLTTTYVEWHLSDWGVNANGQTYGIGSNEKGTPDLTPVMATNGRAGYAYSKDLGGPCANVHSPSEAVACTKENEGKTFSVPVYEADGETLIGQFHVGDGTSITVETPAP